MDSFRHRGFFRSESLIIDLFKQGRKVNFYRSKKRKNFYLQDEIYLTIKNIKQSVWETPTPILTKKPIMRCVFNGEGPRQAIAGRWTFASGCHSSINCLYRAGRSGCWLEKEPWHGTVGVGTLALRSTSWSAHIIGLRHDSNAGRSKVKDGSSRIREIVMPNDIEVLIAQDIGRRYWAGSTPRNGELERNIGEEIEDIWIVGSNAESIIQYSKRPDGLRSWCWISGITCVVLQSWSWLSQL